MHACSGVCISIFSKGMGWLVLDACFFLPSPRDHDPENLHIFVHFFLERASGRNMGFCLANFDRWVEIGPFFFF